MKMLSISISIQPTALENARQISHLAKKSNIFTKFLKSSRKSMKLFHFSHRATITTTFIFRTHLIVDLARELVQLYVVPAGHFLSFQTSLCMASWITCNEVYKLAGQGLHCRYCFKISIFFIVARLTVCLAVFFFSFHFDWD